MHHHSGKTCHFNFNSDLSGDVEITIRSVGEQSQSLLVNGFDLRSFIFAHVRLLREEYTDAEIMAMIVKG